MLGSATVRRGPRESAFPQVRVGLVFDAVRSRPIHARTDCNNGRHTGGSARDAFGQFCAHREAARPLRRRSRIPRAQPTGQADQQRALLEDVVPAPLHRRPPRHDRPRLLPGRLPRRSAREGAGESTATRPRQRPAAHQSDPYLRTGRRSGHRAPRAEVWRDGGRTAGIWRSSLERFAYPQIGAKRVNEISSADVMRVLLPIWNDKRATATKLKSRIGGVMAWAIAQGYRTDNPAGDAIAAALPRTGAQQTHHRALPHRVPLSSRALEVLADASAIADESGLLFPSPSGRKLSDATMSKLLKERKIGAVPHGFRSSFCPSPSARRSRSCVPKAQGCGRSPAGWVGRRRRSRVSCAATPRRGRIAWSIGRRRRSGKRSGGPAVRRSPSSPQAIACERMWPTASPGRSRWPLTASSTRCLSTPIPETPTPPTADPLPAHFRRAGYGPH